MPWTIRCIALVLMLAASPSVVAAEAIPPDERVIAQVEAGHLDEVAASVWGFDPEDATASLQAAFDSKAETIVVPDMGSPWIVTTIRLPSDKTIRFESGVVIEAKRGAFLGRGDCLFSALGCENLTLEGQGAVFRMHKDDYHKPPYEPAEWRHALSLRGCENVTVTGFELQNSGGDGIYIGAGQGGATNRNIIIRCVDCDGNNRQGISVITAEHLLIEDCLFRNTSGTAPQAGIDFEPNKPEERLVDCVVRNAASVGNAGQAYHIYLGSMHRKSPPVSIRFENCTSRDCGGYSACVALAHRDGKPTVGGTITFSRCDFHNDAKGGVFMRGSEFEGCRVIVEKCEIHRPGDDGGRAAPIAIAAPRPLDRDGGNVRISDCTIYDAVDRRPLDLLASPLHRIRGLSGTLTSCSPGNRTTYTLDAEQLAAWFPEQGLVDEIPPFRFDWRSAAPVAQQVPLSLDSPNSFRLRREACLIVWCEAGESVDLEARFETVGRATMTPGTLTAVSRSNEVKTLAPAGDSERTTYRWTPDEDGPLLLRWQSDSGTTLRVVECSAPFAFLGQDVGVHCIHPEGMLYFAVPREVRRFALQVTGQGTAETVRARVRDASGRVVAAEDNIGPPHAFVLEREDASETGIWSIELARASEGVLEDVTLQTLGIPPLFAPTPSGLIVPDSVEVIQKRPGCINQ